MKIDNYLLEKCIGTGAFSKVYVTKKEGDSKLYATKQYERDKIEKSLAMKYVKNEVTILQKLNHPNIVKFIDLKKTKNHFYIMMEYCNGGELSKALENYEKKFGKPFNEEIVQYFMRQIISAFKDIHNKRIIHRDIKLENFLLHYKNEQDKNDLNLMNSQIKIIDFGFSCIIDEGSLAHSTVGNAINADPLILQKLFNKYKRKFMHLGYDQKADIWSLGTIFYEMLTGRDIFDAVDLDEFINKIETIKYTIPTTLSIEAITFLNAMLQYEPNLRLDINKLEQHNFITKNVKDFNSINIKQVSHLLDKDKKNLIRS